VAYRIGLIGPISADFAVLVGDAIRNLRSSHDQVAYQLAVQHSGPLTEDAERMTQLPIRHLRRAVRRLGDFDEQTDVAAPRGDLREAGVPDDSLGSAVRRAAEAITGRSM
jgi:hypothetical protein